MSETTDEMLWHLREAIWGALKQRCAPDPERAVRLVMVTRDDVFAALSSLSPAPVQAEGMREALDPWRRAYALSVEPFDLSDEEGVAMLLPKAWPTVADLRRLVALSQAPRPSEGRGADV